MLALAVDVHPAYLVHQGVDELCHTIRICPENAYLPYPGKRTRELIERFEADPEYFFPQLPEPFLPGGKPYGDLARCAAERYGCTVTAVNIFREQLGFARQSFRDRNRSLPPEMAPA